MLLALNFILSHSELLSVGPMCDGLSASHYPTFWESPRAGSQVMSHCDIKMNLLCNRTKLTHSQLFFTKLLHQCLKFQIRLHHCHPYCSAIARSYPCTLARVCWGPLLSLSCCLPSPHPCPSLHSPRSEELIWIYQPGPRSRRLDPFTH